MTDKEYQDAKRFIKNQRQLNSGRCSSSEQARLTRENSEIERAGNRYLTNVFRARTDAEQLNLAESCIDKFYAKRSSTTSYKTQVTPVTPVTPPRSTSVRELPNTLEELNARTSGVNFSSPADSKVKGTVPTPPKTKATENGNLHVNDGDKKGNGWKTLSIVLASVLGLGAIGTAAYVINEKNKGNNTKGITFKTGNQDEQQGLYNGQYFIPNKTEAPTPTPYVNQNNGVYGGTQSSRQSSLSNERKVEVINQYIQNYQVPNTTVEFLNRNEVVNFLLSINNEDQLVEVMSAICFGYETNALLDKDGNFKLREDGRTELEAYTHDFLCAKVAINEYSPVQMLAVFGGEQVSYNEVIRGMRNFSDSLRIYGMNGKETPPFKYLTNGEDTLLCRTFTDLFEKLATVNIQREGNYLNSVVTDEFLATVENIFMAGSNNDQLSIFSKMICASMVDSYSLMQANVDNGEPLYVHSYLGIATPGDNLRDVNGEFVIEQNDRTAFKFGSIYDAIVEVQNDNDPRLGCTAETGDLHSNIQTMNMLAYTGQSKNDAQLAAYLNNAGYSDVAERINNGENVDEVLSYIAANDTRVSENIDSYLTVKNQNTGDYIPFSKVCSSVDGLLGIRRNNTLNADFTVLVRNRMNLTKNSNINYEVYGQRFTRKANTYTPGSPVAPAKPGREVVTTVEEVTEDQLTPDELQDVQDDKHRIEEELAEENQDKIDEATQVAQDTTDDLISGNISAEEAIQNLEDAGITVDPGYIDEAERIKRQNEEIERQRQEAIAAAERERLANEQAERDRQAQEAERQRQEREAEMALIQGQTLEDALDQVDDGDVFDWGNPDYQLPDEEVYQK